MSNKEQQTKALRFHLVWHIVRVVRPNILLTLDDEHLGDDVLVLIHDAILLREMRLPREILNSKVWLKINAK
jgi:hypothetical protein